MDLASHVRMAASLLTLATCIACSSGDRDLVGEWRNSAGFIYAFGSDEKLTLKSSGLPSPMASGRYSARNGTLTMQMDSNPERVCDYRVEGNTLRFNCGAATAVPEVFWRVR
jgi:hypothetical protein